MTRDQFITAAWTLFGAAIGGLLFGRYPPSRTEPEEQVPERLVNGVLTTNMSDYAAWMIRQRRRYSKLLPSLGHSGCQSCQMPWWAVNGHSTNYDQGHGMFPLCDKCFQDLPDPASRLPFYRALYDEWGKWPQANRPEWDVIKAAVERGE